MTYFILSKVLQLPQESLDNKDTTLSSLAAEKCHSSLHPNDISFVYSVFTAIAPNEQHK